MRSTIRLRPQLALHARSKVIVGTAFFLVAAALQSHSLAQSSDSAFKSAEWAKVAAAARKEGRVVLYTQANPIVNERIKADFENAHPGMVLEYSRVVGAALLSKLEQERKIGADGADVAIATEPLWFENLAKAGALKKPAGPSTLSWPARYTVGGAAPVLALEPITMAYNTNLVKTPITGYRDLLRPELKGKIGLLDLVAPVVVAWFDWLEKTQGPDFLAKLAAQDARLFPSSVPSTQATAAGETAVSGFTNPTNSMPLIERGAPIKMVLPSPSFGISYVGGVLSAGRRQNAALFFMDYLTSPRGQTAWSGKGETASPLPAIPGSLDAKSINTYDARPYTAEAVNAYKERWNKLFKAR